MKSSGVGQSNSAPIVIRLNDIVFECPKCCKNIAVDQDAEGAIVQCPQCGTDVIVPPKPSAAAFTAQPPSSHQTHMTPPPPTKVDIQPQTPQIQTQHVEAAALQAKLAVLSAKIKELQHRRADLIAKIMGHIDAVNRILEQLGGLQGAENEAFREWSHIEEKITTAKRAGELSAAAKKTGAVGNDSPQQ